MIKDLTATDIAEIARASHGWTEFQTTVCLELERREYFNKDAPITIDKATIKEKPAIGYYIAAAAILIAGVGGLIWAVAWLIGQIGRLFV